MPALLREIGHPCLDRLSNVINEQQNRQFDSQALAKQTKSRKLTQTQITITMTYIHKQETTPEFLNTRGILKSNSEMATTSPEEDIPCSNTLRSEASKIKMTPIIVCDPRG